MMSDMTTLPDNSLQLKRIIGNDETYDKYKETIILDKGEPLLIQVTSEVRGNTSPILLLGDGESTVADLVESNKIFVNLSDVHTYIKGYGETTDDTIKPILTKESEDSNSPSSDAGESEMYARADHKHTLDKYIPDGADDDSNITEVNYWGEYKDHSSVKSSAGTSSKYAREDHVHKLDRYIPLCDGYNGEDSMVTTIKEGNTQFSGDSVRYARANHVHAVELNIPKPGLTAPIAVQTKLSLESSVSPSTGTSSNYAREDHVHTLAKYIPDPGTAVTPISEGDVEELGSFERYARADHRHAFNVRIPKPQTANSTYSILPSTDSTSSLVGNSEKYSRADHKHKITASTITATLGAARCRKITYGTGNPPTTGAKDGDIYIKVGG